MRATALLNPVCNPATFWHSGLLGYEPAITKPNRDGRRKRELPGAVRVQGFRGGAGSRGGDGQPLAENHLRRNPRPGGCPQNQGTRHRQHSNRAIRTWSIPAAGCPGQPIATIAPRRSRKRSVGPSPSATKATASPSRASPAPPPRPSGAGATFPGPGSSSATSNLSSTLSHGEDWPAQLAAAGLCGAFGLAGYFLKAAPAGQYCYLLAYLAGGWYTAREVWERLREAGRGRAFSHARRRRGQREHRRLGRRLDAAFPLLALRRAGTLRARAGRSAKSAPCSRKRPRWPPFWTVPASNTKPPSSNCARECVCCSSPARNFPVDAEIVKGRTASDESNLTGEATPVEKTVGRHRAGGNAQSLGRGGGRRAPARHAKARCKRSFNSSVRPSSKKPRPSCSPTASALITLTSF